MKKKVFEDISVVVQGAIDHTETAKCLKSIRKYLPRAEIILSTWEGSNVSGLTYDVLIENKDPGAVIFTTGKPVYNNLNRQLLSTQEGLKKANRKYILKLRTDLILTNNKFLNHFDMYKERCDEYKLFDRKIIIPTLYSRKFITRYETNERNYLPFHPSDFFLFGLNQDVKKYFLDTELVKEPEYSDYFKDKPKLSKKRAFDVAWYQYPPEQYFALSCFKRHFADIKMDNYADVNLENIRQSEIAMVNNFIILEYKEHGMYMNKYKFSKNESQTGYYDASGLYFQFMYLTDYKKHCEPLYRIPLKYCYVDALGIEMPLHKLNKHIFRLFDSNEQLITRLEQFLSIPFYACDLIKTALTNLLKFINGTYKNEDMENKKKVKNEIKRKNN